MLTGLHFLLTYQCTYECDHCFVFGSPNAEGTFSISQVEAALDQAVELGTIEWVYFEGGEAFLHYPLLLESLRQAQARGFKTGIVSNAYYATSVENAALALKPLVGLGVQDLSISDDQFHYDSPDSPAKRALQAARQLGLPTGSICIEPPLALSAFEQQPGKPVVGGGVMFRGRAAEKLTPGLPRRPWQELDSCPHEELEHPERVHMDSYGFLQLCQGLCLGNAWEAPLSNLVNNYKAKHHPIAGPLLRGGPAQLAREFQLEHAESYVDECHMCFELRKSLRERYPQYLAPAQMYGLQAG